MLKSISYSHKHEKVTHTQKLKTSLKGGGAKLLLFKNLITTNLLALKLEVF